MSEVQCRLLTPEDGLDILNWRNDPFSRNMSLNKNIISGVEHSKWFAEMLNNKFHIGLIGELNHSKIGVVFFKINNFCARVSINLNPLHRGKKLAATLLRNSMHDVQIILPNIDQFIAEIENTNTSSIKVFSQNGFMLKVKKDRFSFYSVKSKSLGVK